MVLAFHGTKEKFKLFDDALQGGLNYGPGFYFTESFEEARGFIMSDDGGWVLSCELSISNPFDARSAEHVKLLASCLELNWGDIKANDNHMDPDCGFDEIDRDNALLKLSSQLLEDATLRSYEAKKGVRQLLEDLGFDGIYDPARGWWVAFRSSQVKVTQSVRMDGYCGPGWPK